MIYSKWVITVISKYKLTKHKFVKEDAVKEFIYEWITVIITSVITLTIFESLLPNDNIKKTGMFIGKLIFLLSVIIPIVTVINNSWNTNLWEKYYGYSFEMEQAVYENVNNGLEAQKQLIENLYYQNTVDLIENFVCGITGIGSCKADIILDKSENQDMNGAIKKIYVYISYSKSSGQRPSVSQIESKISEYFEVPGEYVYVEVM